jgi:hypothetical protein
VPSSGTPETLRQRRGRRKEATMSRRARMRIAAAAVMLGSLGIGSAAMAMGPGGGGPPGHTGQHKPCPKTGYTSRPCTK